MHKSLHISFVGAGNMAFRLSIALQEAGHTIDKICCRTAANGQKLAAILSSNGGTTTYTGDYSELLLSDVVIFAVSDSSISSVAKVYADIIAQGANPHLPHFFHTSGATSLDALKPLEDAGAQCGVFYPMMTLSKSKNVNFAVVPLLLEAQNDATAMLMQDIAGSLRCEFHMCDSAKRLQMHCAAVFASNFVNYALSLAYELAGDKAPYLIPTAIEAVRKACISHPDHVQTGPALRGDTETLEKHISILRELNLPEHEEIYRLISKNIPDRVKKRK